MENYRLTREAEADLARIYFFGLDRFGESQADFYFEALFERFEEIARRPFSYPSVEHIHPDYRRCTNGTDSIYFRLVDNVVEIIRILGQQDIDQLR